MAATQALIELCDAELAKLPAAAAANGGARLVVIDSAKADELLSQRRLAERGGR